MVCISKNSRSDSISGRLRAPSRKMMSPPSPASPAISTRSIWTPNTASRRPTVSGSRTAYCACRSSPAWPCKTAPWRARCWLSERSRSGNSLDRITSATPSTPNWTSPGPRPPPPRIRIGHSGADHPEPFRPGGYERGLDRAGHDQTLTGGRGSADQRYPMQDPNPEDPTKKFQRLLSSEDETQSELSADPVTPEGATRVVHHPALDEHDMPLPRRVEEIDLGATRVTPTAVKEAAGTTVRRSRRSRPRSARSSPAARWRQAASCLLRALIAVAFIAIALGVLLAAFGVYEYYTIAATLPSVSDLRARAAQFETTRILDRNGNTLYEILDPNAGRRTYVTLDHIAPELLAATLAT